MLDEKLLKPYNPKETEEKIYKLWEESGFFNPDTLPLRLDAQGKPIATEPYSIVLPPPNVTGTLHMGHAAMLAVEDILIRHHRMLGEKTLWLPGTDHAAIATQSKVEQELYKKEKKTRHDLGRETFLARVEKFAKESHDTIENQLKRMGSSLDWSREAFTLDEARSFAVRTAFKRMYDAGLIYRGSRIVNWDPAMQTTVSDDEIEWKEQETPFYYLTYGPFTIGTARPETKFGDKYVVMHPDDARYKDYAHGQKIELEWINGPVTATIIKDEAVDMEFGTGVMTITPWHDATDFEIAERHHLEKEQIINERGLLLAIAGEFAGQHIKKARPLIVEKLKGKGLVARVEEKYKNRIATNSRGGGVIEPQIKLQWFIDVDKKFTFKNPKITGVKAEDEMSLKELMHFVVESGQIEIVPDHFKKTYFHWIQNLRPWCISRQIWYGHRIPVWYARRNNADDAQSGAETSIHVGVDTPKGENWTQDPDTLDTWFSSGLWTFSTLGWPKETNDLKLFHPTSVLETGYDILFFWVARMILMTGFLLEDIPFKTVYLHGLVRDEKGRKMSKSLGNIIDPLDMIEKYGADATRISLIIGAAPGNDIKLSEEKVRGYKHFSNKIWNIARFILTATETTNLSAPPSLTAKDESLKQELYGLAKEVSEDIKQFKLHLAGEQLYQYAWHTLADTIIEESKPILRDGSEEEKKSRAWILRHILEMLLKLLHPFMPFITEELWSMLPDKKDTLLIVSEWPK